MGQNKSFPSCTVSWLESNLRIQILDLYDFKFDLIYFLSYHLRFTLKVMQSTVALAANFEIDKIEKHFLSRLRPENHPSSGQRSIIQTLTITVEYQI